MAIRSNKIGRFSLPDSYVNYVPTCVMTIMSKCIIVKATRQKYADRTDYVAICELFDEFGTEFSLDVYDDLDIPKYRFVFENNTLAARREKD